MNYTVAPTDATVAITCDQETGFTREGNDVTFTAAATYVFTVTATNDAGEASGTITVTVSDGSSPSTPDAPQITINEPTAEVNLEGGEAEYTLDCSKVIFIYVADERVDFRELLKELASRFRCRIELRQVGPRNKSKIIGGLGMCGMETCCSRFLNDFDVVSINMAKNQLLALNIQKLSGQCGKLMCCLKYEDAQYKKMRQGLPKLNAQIEYKGKKYRVTSMNVLLQQAKIENREDVQFLDFKELWPDIDFSDR